MSDDEVKQAVPGLDVQHPVGVTDEEAKAGFRQILIKNPKGHYGTPFGPPPEKEVFAVVRDLGSGLRAVKTEMPDGAVRYAIHNDDGKPVQDYAVNLDELLNRFPI